MGGAGGSTGLGFIIVASLRGGRCKRGGTSLTRLMGRRGPSFVTIYKSVIGHNSPSAAGVGSILRGLSGVTPACYYLNGRRHSGTTGFKASFGDRAGSANTMLLSGRCVGFAGGNGDILVNKVDSCPCCRFCAPSSSIPSETL